jgi:hypothetical protein
MSTRRGSRQQSGQALVAVIVLIALLFLIGTAMTLAVSSSLQTVRQTANEDWRGYAAESAAMRDLAGATNVTPAAGCGALLSQGPPVNGVPVSAMRCTIAGVDSTAVRQDAIAAQNVAGNGCVKPVVNVASGSSLWGTIAWLPRGSTPVIRVIVDEKNSCPTGSGPGCPTFATVGVLYFRCDAVTDPDGDGDPVTLHIVLGPGGKTYLSAFYVRSAPAGNDCVVTSAGIAGGAVDEGDLVVPNCNPPATSLAFWNKLQP